MMLEDCIKDLIFSQKLNEDNSEHAMKALKRPKTVTLKTFLRFDGDCDNTVVTMQIRAEICPQKFKQFLAPASCCLNASPRI
jgi:hypothetical protein